MKFTPLNLSGPVLIEPDVFRDERGFFMEAFHARKYADAGIHVSFVQDNQSRSLKNVLRGLHAQLTKPQGKLVRVLSGRVWDVVVDVRVDSPTYKKWEGVELSAENFRQLWIPSGFLHGFVTLSAVADLEYKCTALYDPADEIGVIWNEPEFGIRWPVEKPLLSPRDLAHPRLKGLESRLSLFPKSV